MKHLLLTAASLLAALTISSFTQNTIVVDLQKEVNEKRIDVYNRELELNTEGARAWIRLSKDIGEGVAWFKDIELSNGTVEFDVRGENVKQHSFVGIAFHGQNNSTFDAIYLRPFQFKEQDQVLRSHAIQYVALPDNPWRTLRANFPTKFEHSIDPSPDPNSWVHLRIVIQDATVSTYINSNKEPSLVVEKVSHFKKGKVGFYVADTSGGDFSNLVISKTN